MIELKCKCGTTEVTAEAYYALGNLKCETCGEQKQARKKLAAEDTSPWKK